MIEHTHSHSHSPSQPGSRRSSRASSIHNISPSGEITPTQKKSSAIPVVHSPAIRGRSPLRSSRSHHATATSPSSADSFLYGHPVATRASLVQTAQDIAHARSPSPSRQHFHRLSADSISSPVIQTLSNTAIDAQERTPLLSAGLRPSSPVQENGKGTYKPHAHGHEHGHGHGSMNMRALVLHVIGDALGNVGVIATGLIIWLTTWKYKYYCDPIISLVITIIIFSSALPLGELTSYTFCHLVKMLTGPL